MSKDEYREPPRLTEGQQLDFSQFHPFDHAPFTARCRSLYGGPRNHLKMAWVFKWGPELRRQSRCRIGIHSPRQVTKMKDHKPFKTWVSCGDCGKRLSNVQPV